MSDATAQTEQTPPFPEHIVLGPEVGEGATPAEIVETLKAVYDPEIGINVVDLGLVYGVNKTEEGEVNVTMTLTSPACPLAPVIMDQAQYVVGRLPGVENVNVEFVWTPPWDPRVHASEEAKAELGIW